jgi:hypothetical protein
MQNNRVSSSKWLSSIVVSAAHSAPQSAIATFIRLTHLQSINPHLSVSY